MRTAALRDGTINEDVTVYGTVVPAPGAVRTLSVSFESRVLRVMVSDGQRISRGDLLLELEPSPDTYLQLEEARSAQKIANEQLQHVQQKFDLKLATNDQLLSAQEAFQRADLRLKSFEERGVQDVRKLQAGFPGLASRVYVQPGAIVAAGQALADTISEGGLEVRLEVEPEDVAQVLPSHRVALSRASGSPTTGATGEVRKIARAVDPATRLVDVFVSLPPSSSFLLGEYVVARMTIASSRGLLAPRAAVLPADGRFRLFTVEQSRAVQHFVEVGLENDEEVEVIAKDLSPGAVVVVLGNHELTDGMAVTVAQAK